ncbi:RNA polymerase sigma-70 factor [Actinopolymorpha sp. B11F2]|uniref:RNA polymerase sigma-70 factor n=1 Tax=Actinopolymorpha sp. B11F2 TaxID=3160862 RepID=UPI0032E3EC8E
MTTDLAAEHHDELRPLMFSIAYRMLGSVAEAEDVVQEGFLRLHRTPAEEVRSVSAYAVTVTTRLAIDQLRSARVRRERYVGSWLPEPLLATDVESDPAVRAERADSLSLAFLVVLETLSPVERAVFLLREVFGYDYDEIARIVEKSVVNCRQIFTRASRRIAAGEPRFEASRERRDDLARAFFAACETGDITVLEQLLAEDVVFDGDGGGKAPAIARPIRGRVQVARFMLGIIRQVATFGGRIEPTMVNGQPGGRMVDAEGRLAAIFELQIADGQVRALRNVLNPDKLRHLGPLVDPASLPGAGRRPRER